MGKYKALRVGVGKSRESVQAGKCLVGSCASEQGLSVMLSSSAHLQETYTLIP